MDLVRRLELGAEDERGYTKELLLMARDEIKRLNGKIEAFQDDMKSRGIHVGMRVSVICVTCGEVWPCQDSGLPLPLGDE